MFPKTFPSWASKQADTTCNASSYWHFAKLYWNPAWSFEENVHVNFDWYRPHYAHRQTEEEVRQWCAEAELTIT